MCVFMHNDKLGNYAYSTILINRYQQTITFDR